MIMRKQNSDHPHKSQPVIILFPILTSLRRISPHVVHWESTDEFTCNTLYQNKCQLPVSRERKSLVKTIRKRNGVTNYLELKRYYTKASDTSMVQNFHYLHGNKYRTVTTLIQCNYRVKVIKRLRQSNATCNLTEKKI